MKTIKILIAAMLFLFVACQNDENTTSKPLSVYPTYLEVNEDLDHVAYMDFSLEDEKIYLEARERFDKNVTFQDGQFKVGTQTAVHLNISEELYLHFCKVVQITNDNFKKNIVNGVELSNVQDSRMLKVKTRSEGSTGGTDGFKMYWYGFDVYLSNHSLLYIAAGGNAVSLVCSNIPDPSLATKVVGGACGLAGTLASLGAALYPNGIIISFTYPFTGTCIPYYITAQ